MVSAFMPIFSDGAIGNAKDLRELGVADVVGRSSDGGDLAGS